MTAYPWPFDKTPRWVEAKTVYLKDKEFMDQPLTTKEMAQLLNLREDWGTKLATEVWHWAGGQSPALWLLVEFVLAAGIWLVDREP